MTIKHPVPGDIPQLTQLWQQAFGDSADFIGGFFRTGFSQDRCLLAKEQGQLLAALYWFDCLWEGKKLAYLYAIATDEAHRGKGICKALMEKTHGLLKEKSYHGAILVPADEGLEKMYGKMGYRSILPGDLSYNEPPKRTDLQMLTPEEYLRLRQTYLPTGSVQHGAPAMAYLATFACFYRSPEGICCGDPTLPMEYLPGYPGDPAMYLPLTRDQTLPSYFALPMG